MSYSSAKLAAGLASLSRPCVVTVAVLWKCVAVCCKELLSVAATTIRKATPWPWPTHHRASAYHEGSHHALVFFPLSCSFSSTQFALPVVPNKLLSRKKKRTRILGILSIILHENSTMNVSLDFLWQRYEFSGSLELRVHVQQSHVCVWFWHCAHMLPYTWYYINHWNISTRRSKTRKPSGIVRCVFGHTDRDMSLILMLLKPQNRIVTTRINATKPSNTKWQVIISLYKQTVLSTMRKSSINVCMFIHACTHIIYDTCLLYLYIANAAFLLQVAGTDRNLHIGGVLIRTPLDALFLYIYTTIACSCSCNGYGILHPYTSTGNINIYMLCACMSCMYVYLYMYVCICMCVDYR